MLNREILLLQRKNALRIRLRRVLYILGIGPYRLASRTPLGGDMPFYRLDQPQSTAGTEHPVAALLALNGLPPLFLPEAAGFGRFP